MSLTEFKERSYTPRALNRTKLPNSRANENLSSSDAPRRLGGRLLALDLGEKRVGVAVSDELLITVRPLPPLHRTNWKDLLRAVADLLRSFDAQALVIGLPLNLDGSEGVAAQEARQRARDFELSLKMPVYLQDERLTSREAEDSLRAEGCTPNEVRRQVDSRSATIILRDFISSQQST